MSLISLDEGRAHLRVEPDYPAEQIPVSYTHLTLPTIYSV